MVINYYKPKGISSFKAVSQVKKAVKSRKAGHAGTLDPLADGVLIILTDSDTKRQKEFMEMQKEYRATVLFGIKSPSYDLETNLEIIDSGIAEKELKKRLNLILPSFIGEIEQQVPSFSAVKVGGKRLYKLARKGNLPEEELPVRKVNIYDVRVEKFEEIEIEVEGNKYILPATTLLVTCSKGTYIRSLANDLGKKLGVGGVLYKLTRMRVGEYKIEDSKKLEDL